MFSNFNRLKITYLSLKREGKIRRRLFTSSTERGKKRFSRLSLAGTTKNRYFGYITYCFFDELFAVRTMHDRERFQLRLDEGH